MNISVEVNHGPNRLDIPYLARVTIPYLAGRQRTFTLPVRASYLGLKKTLRINICGFEQQTGRFDEVPRLIEKLLLALINAARLPTYVFIARHAHTVYPVYTIDDEVVAVTPKDGPLLRHVELAKVREYLTDYLHEIKVLGSERGRDKLHVRGVDRTTLQLNRPTFYLKKRIVGQTDFWAPVFESDDGERIFTYAANYRREVAKADGREVLALRNQVAHFLMLDKRLEDYYDLRPDRLFPDGWRGLQRHLTRAERSLHTHNMILPVYLTADDVWISAERRPDEERYNLYLGTDRPALEAQVCANLARRGL